MKLRIRPLLLALLLGAGAIFVAFEVSHADGHEQCFPDPAEDVEPFTPVGNPQPATVAEPTKQRFVPTSPYINPTGPISQDVP